MNIPDSGYIVDVSQKGYAIFDSWPFECALTCPEKIVYIILQSHALSAATNKVFPSNIKYCRKGLISGKPHNQTSVFLNEGYSRNQAKAGRRKKSK